MYVVIVEKSIEVAKTIEDVARQINPQARVGILSIVSSDTTIIDGQPDFFFWAGDIHGGGTANQMLRVFSEAFPRATHVAISSSSNHEQMRNGCTVSCPKPFRIEDLRRILSSR